MSAQPVPHLTVAEYLAIERKAETKHEFYHGEMFAMAGASRAHNRISLNIASCLNNQLGERGCEVFMSDMRVQVNATDLYTYPDVVATCERPCFADDNSDTLLNPQVIIEVLSPSTESYDRGKKFEHYRQLESLQEYLLVAQDRQHIDRFIKQADGRWALDEAREPDGVLALESVDAQLPLSEVYARVEFEGRNELA